MVIELEMVSHIQLETFDYGELPSVTDIPMNCCVSPVVSHSGHMHATSATRSCDTYILGHMGAQQPM